MMIIFLFSKMTHPYKLDFVNNDVIPRENSNKVRKGDYRWDPNPHGHGEGGGGSKSQAWGNDPRTIPERKHPLVGLGNTRGAFGQVDNCSIRIR